MEKSGIRNSLLAGFNKFLTSRLSLHNPNVDVRNPTTANVNSTLTNINNINIPIV
jgi:hypothetical protein